jgi:uncharacterized DUF497 family protein
VSGSRIADPTTGMINFEWDPIKAATNLEKHSVSFSEAVSTFADPVSLTIYDPDHSETEDRYLLLGISMSQRLLVVGYTERNGTMRIISARKANRSEVRQYLSRH